MITFPKLLLRNLLYHWRGNFAVFLGIALGSAVLTGALLVGDSLRGSLKSLTLDQLGWVEEAMVPGRFFREPLATEVSAERRAPALLLQGSAARKDTDERVGKVTVFGVDASFWPADQIPEGTDFWSSQSDEVGLNRTLAKALGVNVGDMVELHLQRASNVPSESLMGQRKVENVIQKLSVKVRRILADEGMARFSLKPTPEPVRNAFVPIRTLQRRLDLAGRANAIFVAQAKPTLHGDLQGQLTLADWGLRYRSPKDRAEAFFRLLAGNSSEPQLKRTRWQDRSTDPPVNRVPDELADAAEKNKGVLTREQVIAFYEKSRDYHVLESERMMLEPHVVRAIEKLEGKAERWRLTPILIYLADTLSDGKNEVPYSIIASDDETFLKEDEIVLTQWAGSPLKAQQGGSLTVTYYVPDEKNQLVKKNATFKVRFPIEPIKGVFDDPDFVPEVPGVTDKLDITSWENPPFPYDPRRNTPADIAFSKRYRTTPRAYINLKKAKELWANRFGDLTSIRFRMGLELPDTLPKALLAELKPEQGGFVFQPIREQALQASRGTTDFGEYFLYFSFFLIVSALLLVGLLVRLNMDRRAGEMGLLLATGWSHGRVQRLLLGEGALLAIVGGLVGLAGAILYAKLMLKMLAVNWPGGEGLNFLRVHVEPVTFAIGYLASLVVSMLTLWWATRVLGKLSPRALLHGEAVPALPVGREKSGIAPALAIFALLLAGCLIVLGMRSESSAMKGVMFFCSGAMLLTAALAAILAELRALRHAIAPQPSLLRLGIRNAGRQTVRSLLTVGLLASSSFLIVAVESFHKEADQHFNDKAGGSVGFALYAEGNVPVFEDLNQIEVRDVVFYPCRVQPGDDASCLNLYKPLMPRVMSVSNALIERGGGHFGATLAASPDERANPWRLLQRQEDDGAIPALIDATTAQHILKVSPGETVEVKDADGKPIKLRIVALLQESIFQSEILIAEENFKTLYPQQQGFSFFLVDTGNADAEQVKKIEQQLRKSLTVFNLDVQTTASRLQGYLAVENMYLATFQALGGLGLLLGAVGLSIVLLRGVWERRAELALLQALGFRSGQLAWLVLVENAFLLILGLAAGTVSALLAVAPHLLGTGAQVLWLRIAVLLILVLAVGLLSAGLAVWSTLRTPVLTALRRE